MMHESRRSVDKRTCTAFVPTPPESVFCTENDAADARAPPTVSSAGIGMGLACGQIWRKSRGERRMIQAVFSNPLHPEYGVATIPFSISHDQYAYCMEMLTVLFNKARTS